MRLEELVEVYADHHEICRIDTGSVIFNKILVVANNVLSVARRMRTEPPHDGEK